MNVFKDIFPLREHLKTLKRKGKSIGFVPTMGALHDGHLSLIENSLQENDVTVCSIYVNPAQFNNKSDLKSYPRNLKNDINLLEAKGCQIVFTPSDEVMYPSKAQLKISFGHLENVMEGAFRPEHFNGVAMIVSKLFNIINPTRAYFGQKDLQQFLIIKQLTNDLSFPIELRCIEIVREDDGLAKSSRNVRLTREGREKSVVLHQALKVAQNSLTNGRSIEESKNMALSIINVSGVKLDYFEVVDANSLKSIANISEENYVALCVAAFVGKVRLIDNMVFSLNSKK